MRVWMIGKYIQYLFPTSTFTIRNLGVEFGLHHSQIAKIVNEFRDHIYLSDPYLNRCRNLSVDG